MIITCPACSTRYLMNLTDIPPQGQVVRCSGCGHSWRQAPEVVVSPGESPSSFIPPSLVAPLSGNAAYHEPDSYPTHGNDEEAEHVLSSRGRPESSPALLMMGWAMILGVILTLGSVAYLFKTEIQDRLPEAYRFNLSQTDMFKFLGVKASHRMEGGKPVFTADGTVTNTGSAETPLPTVRLSFSRGNSTLKSIDFSPEQAFGKTTLGGGMSTAFRLRMDSPPAEALDLRLEFVGATKPSDSGNPVPLPLNNLSEIQEAPLTQSLDSAPALPENAPQNVPAPAHSHP